MYLRRKIKKKKIFVNKTESKRNTVDNSVI